MKYLRLFEEHTENLDVILSTIVTENPEKILDYIGLDKDEYEVNTTTITNAYVEILMSSSHLEKFMDIEDGMLSYMTSLASQYNNYEYYVDDDELNYVSGYLSGSTINKIKELADILDYEIDPEEENEIKEFFEYLGLKELMKEIKNEISMENERAVEKAAAHVISLLPFGMESHYNKKFNLEILFNYQEVIDYIKKHNLKIKTIKDLLENIYDADEFTTEIEYGDIKQQFLGDFDDVNRCVMNAIDNYVDNPDEIFPKLIETNNLELLQSKKELANFVYHYKIYIDYKQFKYNLFDFAIHYKNDILEWFKTFEFQEWFIQNFDNAGLMYKDSPNSETLAYKLLKKYELLNIKTIEEYEYLVDAERYNL
jgi:hypothetical protein